uniref:Uncharacterized protein n=1 Tax=Ascaris lumbricoides TaxID=6252 RepID=A0A0M3I138_ASCLU
MMFFKYRKMFIRFCGNHIIFIILANKFRSPNYVCKNNCVSCVNSLVCIFCSLQKCLNFAIAKLNSHKCSMDGALNVFSDAFANESEIVP